MRKRSTEILQRLLKSPDEPLELQKLQEQYHITDKTLKNDLQEILDFAGTHALQKALQLKGSQLRVADKKMSRQLEQAVQSMDPYHYKMSLEERKLYIAIALLYHEGYYSMQELADELYVTRATIMNDCKVVDQFLKAYKVRFTAKSKRGIRVEGDESRIRLLLIGIFRSLIPAPQDEKAFFTGFMVQKAGFQYALHDVTKIMSEYLRKNNTLLAKTDFFDIAVCVFVIVNRIRQVKSFEEEADTASLQLDTIGEMVSCVARKLGMIFMTRQDIVSIERIILRQGVAPKIQSVNDFELYGVICHFLFEISSEIDINIQSDDLLVKSLVSHMKSMDNWDGVDFDIQKQYGSFDAFTRIRDAAEHKYYILEKYLQYSLSARMKDSIVIHICAALLRNKINMSTFNIIVSCPGSMATSKYLEAQIKNYFNFNVVDTMTTKRIEAAGGNFEGVDFIISTVDIQDSALPVVVVSPLITVEDINKIQSAAFRQKQVHLDEWSQYPLLTRLHAVYTSGEEEKIQYLNKELTRVLQALSGMEAQEQKASSLLGMLKPKYIKINDVRMDWKQAMRFASEDLIRDGYFDESYVQEAIGNVEEYGSYIIVGQGIALAHASREAGVYEDGLSLLVAKEGIVFDEEKTVYLLFFFSQKGNTDYLNLFKEIIELGRNQKELQTILSQKTGAAVHRAISDVLTQAIPKMG